MNTDEARQRLEAFMNADFLPVRPVGAAGTADFRIAIAGEYSAYHLGKISKSLERIAVALEQMAAKP